MHVFVRGLTDESCLDSQGGTDITAALERAVQVLQKRKFANPVTSVFLLTDGRDERATLASCGPLVASCVAAGGTLQTFGYGNDHEAPLLESLAEAGNGSFIFCRRPEARARPPGPAASLRPISRHARVPFPQGLVSPSHRAMPLR